MQIARSASRTWSASRSAVEYTATASSPSSRRVRMTRTAISPRFATSTRVNMPTGSDADRAAVERLELEEELPVFDRLRVLRVNASHDALGLRLHLVHQLHGLEDAERLPRLDRIALLDEGGSSGFRSSVERPYHRRLDPDHPGVWRGHERRLLQALSRSSSRSGVGSGGSAPSEISSTARWTPGSIGAGGVPYRPSSSARNSSTTVWYRRAEST